MVNNRKRILAGLSEDELIGIFTKRTFATPSVLKGIGDDTAVLRLYNKSGRYVLFTQDSTISGRHFDMDKDAPYRIGWKSIARNLSDIAAMAGTPSGALVALGIPSHIDIEWLERVYDGINACARQFCCPVIGGDVSSSEHDVLISISMIGTADESGIVYRNGAQPGNLICVTGNLGGSRFGKHLDFIPRIEEARWLKKKCAVTSLIDVSDGLAKDLFHIVRSSNVGFEIEYYQIPVSDDAVRLSGSNYAEAFYHALNDGEDFELLCTIDSTPEELEHIAEEFKSIFGIACTCIGKIMPDTQQVDLNKNGVFFEKMKIGGFDHFRDA